MVAVSGEQPLLGLLGIGAGGEQGELGGELRVRSQQRQLRPLHRSGLVEPYRARGDRGSGFVTQRAGGHDRGSAARLERGLEGRGVGASAVHPQRRCAGLDLPALPDLLAPVADHALETLGPGVAEADRVGLGVRHGEHGASIRGLGEGVGELGGERCAPRTRAPAPGDPPPRRWHRCPTPRSRCRSAPSAGPAVPDPATSRRHRAGRAGAPRPAGPTRRSSRSSRDAVTTADASSEASGSSTDWVIESSASAGRHTTKVRREVSGSSSATTVNESRRVPQK